MILTNKNISLPKNKVLLVMMLLTIFALYFLTETNHSDITNSNANYQFLTSQKSTAAIVKNHERTANTIFQKNELDNHIQLIGFLTLISVLLGLSTLFFWRKNITLTKETYYIKSQLSQYSSSSISEEELKESQDEIRRQALLLNERQQEILDLMAFGLSNKQIADKLFISENTVKYHIKNIYHVLNVKDRKTLWLSQS